jgi:hypothetical protein
MAKRSKQRECPAIGGLIARDRCGRERNRQLKCPLDCPFNPLGDENIEAFEERVDALVDVLNQHFARLADPERRRRIEQLGEGEEVKAACEIFLGLFHDRQADGLTIAENLLHDRNARLRNDNRLILEAKIRSRVRLLEIRRIRDEQYLEAVDLLNPEKPRFLVRNGLLADEALRFEHLLVRTYELPPFHGIMEMYRSLPAFGVLSGGAVFLHLLESMRRESSSQPKLFPDPAINASAAGDKWLLEKLPLLLERYDRLTEIFRETVRAALSPERIEVTWEERGDGGDLQSRLDAESRLTDFAIGPASDPSTRAWTLAEAPGQAILAHHSVNNLWVLTGGVFPPAKKLREVFEIHAGESLVCVKDHRQSEPRPKGIKRTHLPSGLLETLDQVKDWRRVYLTKLVPDREVLLSQFADWLQRGNPVLGEKAPASVMKIPGQAERKVAEDLVKMQIRRIDDFLLKEDGGSIDLSQTLMAAGFAALAEPVSPQRIPFSESESPSVEEPDESGDGQSEELRHREDEELELLYRAEWESRPLSPFIRTPHQLTTVRKRIDRRAPDFGDYEDIETVIAEISRIAGYRFLTEVVGTAQEIGLSQSQCEDLLRAAAMVFAGLVNKNARIRLPEPGELMAQYRGLELRHWKSLQSTERFEDFVFEDLVHGSSHPAVCGMACYELQKRAQDWDASGEEDRRALQSKAHYCLVAFLETVEIYLGFDHGQRFNAR